MPLVQAYLCPRTDKFFLKKEDYIEHLRGIARESLDKKYHARSVAAVDAKLSTIRKTARSFQDVSAFIEANLENIMAYAKLTEWNWREPEQTPFLNEISFTSLRHSEDCSNTHCRPRNGETNFGCKPDKHRGYPGVTGDIRYQAKARFSVSSVLTKALNISTGSGGGRGENGYQYGFTMFAEDWPFVGARILHMAGRKNLTEDHKRILKYAFPGIPIVAYEGMLHAGVLPESINEFTEFMFQFVDEPVVVNDMDISIPVDLASEL